jgi:hypothetical protein
MNLGATLVDYMRRHCAQSFRRRPEPRFFLKSSCVEAQLLDSGFAAARRPE